MICRTTTKTGHVHTMMRVHRNKNGGKKRLPSPATPRLRPLFTFFSSETEMTGTLVASVLQRSKEKDSYVLCHPHSTRIYVQHLHLALASKLLHPCSRTKVHSPQPFIRRPIYEEDDCVVRGLKASWRDFVFPYSTLIRRYIECKCSRFE